MKSNHYSLHLFSYLGYDYQSRLDQKTAKPMQKSSLFGRFLMWRVRHISERNFIFILSLVVGIASGLTALALKTGVFHLRELLLNDIKFDYHNFLMLLYPTIGIALTVFMKQIVLKDSIKHNISSILHAISKRNSLMRMHKIVSSMIGGILTAGFGGSIGLESPIISSGSAIGSNLGRVLHLNYKSVTLLLACGAAGAIAAIFNTPIAAIVFVFEVLLLDLTRFSLIPLLISSSSGAVLTRIFYEEEILFDFTVIDKFTINDIGFFALFAVVSAFVSLYFTKMFLFMEHKYEVFVKPSRRLLFGALVLGLMIFLFPPLFGEGFETIKSLLSGNHSQILNNSPYYPLLSNDNHIILIIFFSILCLVKVIATVTTIGAGGIGGIFAPSLFTGAISGFLFAYTLNAFFDLNLSVSNFILVGMSCTLGGVLHAPLTGIFLIAEITSGYELIVPLMIATTITFIMVKYVEPDSIVTKQLAAKGELITHNKDKAVLTFMELKTVIERDFRTIGIDATLGDLVNEIAQSKRDIFPVLDSEQKLAGIVHLSDIRDIMFNIKLYEETSVRNLMVIPPALITSEDTMEIVMKKFKKTDAWNLPVVDKGKYVGFVSKSKMFTVYRNLLVNLSEE